MKNHRQLHEYLIASATEIREALGAADIGEMELAITVTGRTLSGDLELNYTLRKSPYDTRDAASGADLSAVLAEYIRRIGWSKRNAPLCLPRAGNDDPVPF